jgi:hypothetical protein
MKKILTNYPSIISFFLPLPWAFVSLRLIDEFFGICSTNISILVMSSFSIMIFPNWLGIFFSNKYAHYIVGGIVWGCLWTVGLVAYEGMDCR